MSIIELINPYRIVLSQEEFEYTKEVIRIRISKKNRQLNDQRKKEQKDKQRSTKHKHKTKDRVTRTPLIAWMYLYISVSMRLALRMKDGCHIRGCVCFLIKNI